MGGALLLATALAGELRAGAEKLAQAGGSPATPRVLHVPTAWLQTPGRVYGSTGLDHRGTGFLAVNGGVGKLAEIDINVTDRFLLCDQECDGDERNTSDARVVSALFKIGTAADSMFAGQPALAIGFRKAIHVTAEARLADSEPRLAELYLAASRRYGPLGLHAGAQLFDARVGSARLLDVSQPARRTRPFAGLEWVPSIYPRTTLLVDFSWVPELRSANDEGDVALRWLAGWGIRYQALSWGSIELAVRHRENEGLSDSAVLVRINGTADLKKLSGRLGQSAR